VSELTRVVGHRERIRLLPSFDRRVVVRRSAVSRWEFGALAAALGWLEKAEADWLGSTERTGLSAAASQRPARASRYAHVLFLQHGMAVVEALPLVSLACPVVFMRRFGPGWCGAFHYPAYFEPRRLQGVPHRIIPHSPLGLARRT